MNESKTAPEAMMPTTVLCIRFPRRPLMTKPAAGNSGISQIRFRKFILFSSRRAHRPAVLPLHQIDLVDVHRFFVLEHRDHDPKADGSFSRGDSYDKNGENLTCDLLKVTCESDQVDVHGIHHEFYRHENDHDVAASENTDDAD